MNLKSTDKNYGSVAIAIHWLSALLILILIVSGFRAGEMEDTEAKVNILRIHLPIGIAVLLLTLARLAWWLSVDKKPLPIKMPVWQDYIGRFVHLVLYIVIIGMAASGVGMIILSGAGPIIFGSSTQPLPDFWEFRPRIPHGIGARVMLGLLVLHIGAALYHQLILKDGLISRIWFNKR